jgi:hypothetical protein
MGRHFGEIAEEEAKVEANDEKFCPASFAS